MKVKEIIKIIEQNGWMMVRRIRKSPQFKHINKEDLVTIAGHLNDDLAKGTLKSIIKQADLKNGREKSV